MEIIMTYKIPKILRDNKDKTISQFWNAKPFPHLCIDDFLDPKHFKLLSRAAADASIKPALTFKTDIEKGKNIFSNKNSPEPIQDIVNILSHPKFV